MLLCLVLAVAGLISGCGGQGETDDGDSRSASAKGEQARAGSEETPMGSSEVNGGLAEDIEGQLTPVDASSPVYGSSYVAPLVEIFGDVWIGEHSFVASNTMLHPLAEGIMRVRPYGRRR
jgi:hypothetical protein